MKITKVLSILFCSLLCFSACTSKGGYLSRDIYAMSTVISLNIPSGTKDADRIFSDVEELIYSLEELLSATKEESEISLFNQSEEGIKLTKDTIKVINTALDVAKNTNGAYDPTCLALTELWNISGGGYLPKQSEIDLALEKVNYSLISLENSYLTKNNAEVKIDLGGVAKGYALEKCVESISKDAEYGMISFGGNVGVWGKKPDSSKWEIGIKDPFNVSDVIGYFKIDEGYVSVSGDYERFFEQEGKKYHHIFDTKSGYPCDNGIHSVAVYTKDGALGDALSTALFVMGYEKAEELYESGIYKFEALFVCDDGLYMTKGAKDIFTEK